MNEVENCLQLWKEDICFQFPRNERPLDVVKKKESENFHNLPLLKTYTKALSFQMCEKLSGLPIIKLDTKKCRT